MKVNFRLFCNSQFRDEGSVTLNPGSTIESFRYAVKIYAQKQGVHNFIASSLAVFPPNTCFPPPKDLESFPFTMKMDELKLNEHTDVLVVIASHPAKNLDGDDLVAHPCTLPRTNILETLKAMLVNSRRLLIKAPPASGKTYLLALLEEQLRGSFEIVRLLAREGMPVPSPLFLGDPERGLLMLDEAQCAFGDPEYSLSLTKTKFSVILAASRGIFDPNRSRSVHPHGFQVASFKDIKLSDNEAITLYDSLISSSPIAIPSARDAGVRAAVLEQCGGHAGSVVTTVKLFCLQQQTSLQSPSDLMHLLFSNYFTQKYTRIWTSFEFHFSQSHRTALMTYLCSSSTRPKALSDLIKQLERGFVINDEREDEGKINNCLVPFLFPLARRRVLSELFGPVAETDRFGTARMIDDLILNAIHSFDPKLLHESSVDQISKERAIQCMMLRGLVASVPIEREVAAELSARLPIDSGLAVEGKGKGELDFYINGSLKWGIELVSDGANLADHIQRFTGSNLGKCFAAPSISDYRVVDFRTDSCKKRKTKEVSAREIQVRFSADFLQAELIFGSSHKKMVVTLGQ
jgi:hypothetical protein